MAYKPPVVSSGGYSRKTVKAKVILSKDKSKVKIVSEGGAEIIFPIGKVPPYVKNIERGTFIVTMAEDNSEVIGVRPVSGVYKVGVERFAGDPERPPAPRINPKWNNQYFVVILTITEGNYVGMQIPFSLAYNFAPYTNPDGIDEVAYTKPQSKGTKLLDEFLTATGCWEDGPIPYSDNVLPEIAKRILTKRKEFNVVLKDGWVETIIMEEDV